MFSKPIASNRRPDNPKVVRFKSHISALVEMYSADLYKYALWLCNDQASAANLVESTFVRAQKNINLFNPTQSAKRELFKILRNENKINPLCNSDALVETGVARPVHDNQSISIDLKRAFQSLPMSQREPLEMQIINGFSLSEIAEFFNISKADVRERLAIARERLLKLTTNQQRAENDPLFSNDTTPFGTIRAV